MQNMLLLLHDDNIYMQRYKQLRCEELIGLQHIVFSLLKQLKKTADSMLIKQQIQYLFLAFSPSLLFGLYPINSTGGA